MSTGLPIFLGVCSHAQRRGVVIDLLGVSDVIVMPFFPQTLNGLSLVFALAGVDASLGTTEITIRPHDSPHVMGTINFNIERIENEEGLKVPVIPGPPPLLLNREVKTPVTMWRLGTAVENRPVYHLIATPSPPIWVAEPMRFVVELQTLDGAVELGRFEAIHCTPLPMTDEERQAIKSRQSAPSSVTIWLGCNACGDRSGFFLALDPNTTTDTIPDGATPLYSAKDVWACRCGVTNQTTTYLKAGLHDILRRPQPSINQEGFRFTPLYERGTIDCVVDAYERLINSTPGEEQVQQFLEKNPILWGFLSPRKILHKPSVLTTCKADFGVLSTSKILYLVEIEKPQTKIAKRDGGVSAELQHALDQVRDWRIVVGNHRGALLSEIGFRPEEVDDIRFIVVAGMARQTSKEGLVKMRRNPPAEAQLYFFDELATFLRRVGEQLTAV